MPNIADVSHPLFAAEVLGTGFTYSPSIEVKEIERVTLLGTVTLNAATFITLRPEVSSDGSTWRPATDFGAASVLGAVATHELYDQEVKRSSSGAMPALTFAPDAAFFRIGAKGDSAGAALTLDAYLVVTE